MKNITMKSAQEIEVLENATNYLNKNLFDNKLSKIKITISPDSNSKRSTYGWAVRSIWKNGEDTAHELNITSNSLKRPFNEIWITLVHELIHIYAFSTGNPTGATSRQGRYHGKEFKELCDKFYLITEKDSGIGYTTPHNKMLPEQKELYNKFLKNNSIKINSLFKYQRNNILKESKSTTKNSTSKYMCQHCGITFTAKKGLSLICGDCKSLIIEINK